APDGVAVLRHAGWLLRSGAGASASHTVAVCGLLDPPVEQVFDAAALADLVTLTLPPTGSCEVSVVDEQQRPLAGAFEARLGFADGAPSGARGGEAIQTSRDGGKVVFERVELERPLRLAVAREGSGAVAEQRLQGPARPDERIRVSVAAARGRAIVRG